VGPCRQEASGGQLLARQLLFQFWSHHNMAERPLWQFQKAANLTA